MSMVFFLFFKSSSLSETLILSRSTLGKYFSLKILNLTGQWKFIRWDCRVALKKALETLRKSLQIVLFRLESLWELNFPNSKKIFIWDLNTRQLNSMIKRDLRPFSKIEILTKRYDISVQNTDLIPTINLFCSF